MRWPECSSAWPVEWPVQVKVEGRTDGARMCVLAWNAVDTAQSEKAGPGLWNPMEALQRLRFVGIKTLTSRSLFPMECWYPNYYTYVVDHSPFPWNAGFYWCFRLAQALEQIPMWTLLLKVPLPESQVQCIYFQIGTPDSQVKFGQKGCRPKTVVEKGACIWGPIRGLYEVNTRPIRMELREWFGLSRS